MSIEKTPPQKGDTAYSSVRHVPIEETDVYVIFAEIADEVWRLVKQWPSFERDTVGKQLVRAADGVTTNLVEGDGRFGRADAIQFFRIARASARETRHWFKRPVVRSIIEDSVGTDICDRINSGGKQLNGLIRYRSQSFLVERVRESAVDYGVPDPLAILSDDE